MNSEPDRPRLLRCKFFLEDSAALVREDIGVVVTRGHISAVTDYSQAAHLYPRLPVDELDGLVLPGFVDAHSHLRGLSLSELGIDEGPLESWLLQLGVLPGLSPYHEALVASYGLLSTGVTSVQAIHHTYAPLAGYVSEIEGLVEALTLTGIRCVLGLGVTDAAEYLPPPVPGVSVPELITDYELPVYGIAAGEYEQLVRRITGSVKLSNDLLEFCLAPVAPQWCSDALLSLIASLSGSGCRVHTHLLESEFQREWLVADDPFSRLARFGLIGPRLSVAHGVWLDEDEITTLGSRGASIVHCPCSNERLEVGTGDVRRWISSGVTVAVGTDGQWVGERPDLFAEMRAAIAQSGRVGPRLTAREMFHIATRGGAAALGHENTGGALEIGRAADLVCLEVDRSVALDEILSTMIESGRSDCVRDVMVGGTFRERDWQWTITAEVSQARDYLREQFGLVRVAALERLTQAIAAGAVLPAYLNDRRSALLRKES